MSPPQVDSESEGSYQNYSASWETQVAEQIQQRVERPECRLPFMVALVGLPGSGKSISAFILANLLEKGGTEATIIPHDGYHYPLEYLKTFPDPEDAIYRRGAPFTFDPAALLRDLGRMRDGDEELITVPAFDHAAGDPEPDKHAFDRNRHKVVICEGLYMLHDKDGWEDVGSVFDMTIFMNADLEKCIDRLKIRNQCIPGYTPEEINIRCDQVDRANALTVLESKSRADMVVESAVIIPDKPTHHKIQSHLDLAGMNEMAIQVEGQGHHDADWTMDISSSRHRSDSFASLTRTDSFVSQQSDLPPPKPAASFVGTWEPDMAERILKNVKVAAATKSRGKPYMVALVGMPGSGKSVSSFMMANLLEDQGIPTMICPHDGYHYPLEYLKSFPDSEDAIYRRGAPDTFDPQSLLRDLLRIRDGDEEVIKLPAFDHHRGDPEPDTHVFDRNRHQVVLCEGLYLLHNGDGWEEIASLFDLKIYMNTSLETCVERVKIRNCCIPGYTPEEIAIRTEKVDRVNAITVLNSKSRADVVVETNAS